MNMFVSSHMSGPTGRLHSAVRATVMRAGQIACGGGTVSVAKDGGGGAVVRGELSASTGQVVLIGVGGNAAETERSSEFTSGGSAREGERDAREVTAGSRVLGVGPRRSASAEGREKGKGWPMAGCLTGERATSGTDFTVAIRGASLCMTATGSAAEIHAVTNVMREDDPRAWLDVWLQVATSARRAADDASARSFGERAAGAYLRASASYTVVAGVAKALNDEALVDAAWAQQQDTWLGFIDHVPWRADEIVIPNTSGARGGWLFRPRGAAVATLVAFAGDDSSCASLWETCAVSALEKSYNVLLLNGPDQLSERSEAPSSWSPVHDSAPSALYTFLRALDGVDPERIALCDLTFDRTDGRLPGVFA